MPAPIGIDYKMYLALSGVFALPLMFSFLRYHCLFPPNRLRTLSVSKVNSGSPRTCNPTA